MEIASCDWLNELELDQDPTCNYECEMNPFDNSVDELSIEWFSFKDDLTHPNLDDQDLDDQHVNGIKVSTESSQTYVEKPEMQLNLKRWGSCTTQQATCKTSSAAPTRLISFDSSNALLPTSQRVYGLGETGVGSTGNISFETLISQGSFEGEECSPVYEQGIRRVAAMTRSPLQAHDHVIAERKRREKLNQLIWNLSAVIPGLKKMDKISVLGDTIKYLKQLQEKVKTLAKQSDKKTMESVVFVKKSQLLTDDESSSSNDNFGSCSEQALPEIQARISDNDILIRIHCEKHEGCLVKILGEIEKLQLNVINSSVLPFGSSSLDITIVAQVEAAFSMTAKDLVRNLRRVLQNFM